MWVLQSRCMIFVLSYLALDSIGFFLAQDDNPEVVRNKRPRALAGLFCLDMFCWLCSGFTNVSRVLEAFFILLCTLVCR